MLGANPRHFDEEPYAKRWFGGTNFSAMKLDEYLAEEKRV
jgi:hypothetical protein